MIDASIIIRTKNESAHLPATLKAVLAQRPARMEVLVVDSGSTDDTLRIAESFGVKTVEIDPGEWSYPKALNLGATQTSGRVIISLSAHCIPASNRWLESLIRHFDDPIIAGAWGPGVAPGRYFDLSEAAVRQHPGSYSYVTRRWGLDNANAAIRRELWEEFPFDETLPAAEDKAWGMEAMARGFDLVYEPAAAVIHETHSVKAAFLRGVKVAQGFNLLFPDERRHTTGGFAKVGRDATHVVSRNMRSPSLASLRKDAARGLSSLATLFGLYVGSTYKNK